MHADALDFIDAMMGALDRRYYVVRVDIGRRPAQPTFSNRRSLHLATAKPLWSLALLGP